MTTSAVPLQELMQYIRILILDDDKQKRLLTMTNLEMAGFKDVIVTGNPQDAFDRINEIDILLTDQVLDPPWDGLLVTRRAKEIGPDHLEVLIYSNKAHEISAEAIDAGATAFIEKSPDENYELLLLWIKEVARRIWLEKILNALPDELVVLDAKDFGKIHFANKTKRDLYEKGKALLCDYCYKRFEARKNKVCKGCPSIQAAQKDQTVRTEWHYISKITEQKCSVDLYATPLKDKAGEIRSVIETCRDRTHHMIADEYLKKIERARKWDQRLSLFLEGFTRLGYVRARFYQCTEQSGTIIFKGIRAVGMPKNFDITRYIYKAESDEPTRILQKRKKPTLFLVDYKNPERPCMPDEVTSYIYRVGEKNVDNNITLQKKKWIELPILAGNKVIGKVSLDTGKQAEDLRFISIYDLDVLEHYATLAGQALQNALQYAKTKMNIGTHKTIIEISKELTSEQFDIEKLKTKIVKRVCRVMNTASCTIFLLEDEDGEKILKRDKTYLIDSTGHRSANIDYKERYKIGEAITGRVYLTEENQKVNDLEKKAEIARKGGKKDLNLEAYDYYCSMLKEPLRNGLFALLKTKQGKIGVIRTMNKRRQDQFGQMDFDQDDMVAFEALAGQIAVAIESANLVAELKTLQKEKTAILENYSHNLKNRLQSLMYISAIMESTPDFDKDVMDMFKSEIRRLGSAANTMLKIAQLEGERFTINMGEVNVPELVSGVAEIQKFAALGKNMKIKTSIETDIKFIIADYQMMHDALLNLLDNAINYGFDNTNIFVEVSTKKDKILFAVKNYGDPIPKEDRKRVFEKFYSGQKVVHNIVQVGIGLTFVKATAEAHNGRALIDPSFKKGVKVVMSIPIENLIRS